MINLNSKMCKELGLTYWQLNTNDLDRKQYIISREENELLRKILLAKGISLNDEIVEIQADGVVVVHINSHQLIFKDVKDHDSENTTHLAKISEMIGSQEQKKQTWYKLKNLDL